MNRITSSHLAFSFVALLGLASLANAQPGPLTGSAPSEPTPMAAPSVNGLLSPAMMIAYLRDKGHKVTSTKGPDGRPILLAQIQHNGWKFDVEIEYMPNLTGFFVTCPLGKAAAKMSAAQLTSLLKANFRYTPDYFTIRDGDNRLAMETNVSARLSTATFQAILNRLLGNVRASQQAWDINSWPNDALAGTTK